jgi:hypothetical protein
MEMKVRHGKKKLWRKYVPKCRRGYESVRADGEKEPSKPGLSRELLQEERQYGEQKALGEIDAIIPERRNNLAQTKVKLLSP